MKKIKVTLINLLFLILIYFSFVSFSYLIFPFKKNDQIIYNYDIDNFKDYHKFVPGIYNESNYNINFFINDAGFRYYKKINANNYINIGIVGGSSVMGLESPNDKTWPYLLEKKLNLKSEKFYIHNFGQSGFTIKNILSLLNEELLEYNLDYLIYYGGYNEYSFIPLERYPGISLYPNGLLNFYKYFLITKLSQIQILLERFLNIRIKFLEKQVSSFQKTHEKFLEEIVLICKKNNIKVILVNQLMKLNKKQFKFYSSKNYSRHQYLKNSSLFDKYLILQYRHLFIRENILKMSNDGIHLINPYNNFNNIKEDFFYDVIHLTPSGNEFLANEVYENFKFF